MTSALTGIFFVPAVLGSSGPVVETAFTEETGVFANPGQGWSTMGGAESWKRNEGLVNLGAVYYRPSWRDFEPADGVYTWRALDDLIAFAASKGVPASFRIMCVNSGSRVPSTPDWVWQAGAKFDAWEARSYGGHVVTNRAPVFDDPVFLRLHARFIRKLAERYDGDPRLAGIDLGSYGNWGEWHCHGLPPNAPARLPPKDAKLKYVPPLKYPLEIRKQYVDLYLDNFKRTPIVFMTDDWECLKYALGTGTVARVGLRRDGVGSPGHFKRWIGREPYDAIPQMGDVWKTRPVWFEFYGSAVNSFLTKGWDMEYSFKWLLANHVTVVNTCPYNPWEAKDLPAFRAAMHQIDLYAGARFVPRRAKVEETATGCRVELTGENKGVARLHLPYELVYEAVDATGRVRASFTGATDPGTWLPGPFSIVENVVLPAGVRCGGLSLRLRLRHRYGVFRDFRFAAKELDAAGRLCLTEMKKCGIMPS